MRKDEEASIFSRYFGAEPFADRFATDSARAVDVIIPIVHTNELWRSNLTSIYREIPVNRLLIGDGGCIDNSLEVARQFPRVEVLDHRNFTSLGYSIRHLIEAVETEWFVYLHSDVFLPPGWFETMFARRNEFDWFECNQRITVMADYLLDTTKVARAYSGSQMGRKAAFANVTPLIDDDYLYRNEDIIFAQLIARNGMRYGKVGETFHFHQIMHKPSRWLRKVTRVNIDLELGADEELRANDTYARGIIKYLDPKETTPDVVDFGADVGQQADGTEGNDHRGVPRLGAGDKSGLARRTRSDAAGRRTCVVRKSGSSALARPYRRRADPVRERVSRARRSERRCAS